MTDITDLIRADHTWFRDQFAALDALRADDSQNASGIQDVWVPLANRLELHAIAEENIFYPQLLRLGQDDPDAETLDAIGDHNDIRDGLHDAARHSLGSADWWGAVGRARAANDEHMAEEEHEGLADFRVHASDVLREELGQQFIRYFATHRTIDGVDISDKDPQTYVDRIDAALHEGETTADPSLGIGTLKGK